jgi:hypothetical protein
MSLHAAESTPALLERKVHAHRPTAPRMVRAAGSPSSSVVTTKRHSRSLAAHTRRCPSTAHDPSVNDALRHQLRFRLETSLAPQLLVWVAEGGHPCGGKKVSP